jgi:L-amino acid N-acyltransferase YncA
MMLYKNPAAGAFYPAIPGLAPLAGQQLLNDHPDLHLQVVEGNQAIAYASLWFKGPHDGNNRDTLNKPTGVIGHYAASNEQAAQLLLEGALAALKSQGCQRVIGPMNGSTWKSYRFVAATGSEAAFFMEPSQPSTDLEQFLANGFVPVAHYHSTLAINPPLDHKMPAVAARLAAAGVSVAAIDPNQLAPTLKAIYQLSLTAFANNRFYSPIDEAEFLAIYQPLLAQIPPQLTRLAWLGQQNPQLVGYAFAVPDLLRPQRDTLIIKTVAVRPGRMLAGLGRLLTDQLHQLAQQLAMPRVIHALMYDQNASAITSRQVSQAQVIRRYLLLGRDL